MNKQEFLNELAAQLSSLSKNEIDKSIAYYNESIDDRIEDGMAEEEAVKALGPIPAIVENILYDMSIPTLMKAKVNESKDRAPNKGIWLALVIVGFPLWFPLLMAFIIVIMAIYVTAWSLIVSLYAVVFSFGIACFTGIIGGFAQCIFKSIPVGLCVIGIAIICGALSLFMIKPVYLITKKLIKLTTYSIRKMKSLFISRKGVA